MLLAGMSTQALPIHPLKLPNFIAWQVHLYSLFGVLNTLTKID